MLLLLLVITIVQGKTVRYSNIPPRGAIATRAYDLEVPGSAPIRIIEAEPIWTTQIPNTTPFYHRDDIEHRSSKPKTGRHHFTTQSTRTTISEPVTHETEHSVAYSPEALNAFLKDYAQKIKADRKKFSVDSDTEEPFTEEPINKLASIYLDNEEKANEDDKQKSWGPVNIQHHKHPYEDKKGWVSLDAVPWSTSKISKWQSNNKNEPKPWENNKPQQSSWNSNNNRPKHPFLNHDNGNNKFNSQSNGYNTQGGNYNDDTSSYNGNTNNYNGYNGNPNKYNQNPYVNHQTISDKNSFYSNNNNNNNEDYNPNESIFFDKPVATYDQDIRPSNDFPSHDFPSHDMPSKPNFPPERPQNQYSRPTYGYDAKPIKIKPEPANSWQDEMPSRPSFILRPLQSQHSQSQHSQSQYSQSQHLQPQHSQPHQPSQWSNNNMPGVDPWSDRHPQPPQSPQFMYVPHSYNKDENRDIITDGRPGDFPKPSNPGQHFPSYHHDPEPEEKPQDHPPSHPANGNGEWVLVSTTKGYQYPRSKHQRSIEVTPDSIGTRRGIRLTVLPPDEDANINMTTSHGGLLEVESTFETVEESQNKYVEIKLHNVTSTRIPHKKKPVRKQVVITPRPVTIPKPVVAVLNHNKNRRPSPAGKPVNDKHDASALMAAVGAGMIPATMAMLVPFVGRRKRSFETNLERTVNVTNVPMHIYQRNF